MQKSCELHNDTKSLYYIKQNNIGRMVMIKFTIKILNSMVVFLIALSIVSCSDSDSSNTSSNSTEPSVISTIPADGDFTEGVLTGNITATFSKEMDPSTLISPAITFTLIEKTVGATALPGTVSYSGNVATFNPTDDLIVNKEYTATITVAAADLAGNPMAASKIWSFSTSELFDNPSVIDLGAAGTIVIFGDSGISTVPTSVITGDIGTTSAAGTLTGFGLISDSTNVFSTSSQVVGGGKVYAFDYSIPTPDNMTLASGAIGTAYTDGAGRAADATELFAGDITGKTLRRGVYKWTTNVHADIANFTLKGSATDVWIFITSGEVILNGGARVILADGALAKNIFWVSAENVTLQPNTHFEGIVLGKKAVILQNGATVNGRLFSQTGVTLIANTVTKPAL
jgi:hypothetical protein